VSSSRPPDMSSGADDARQQERDVHKPRVSKLEIAVWVFLLAILVAVAGPFFMTPRLAADRTTALSSIKCMNLALIAFDNDYGRFPDATTIADVKAATHTTIPLGDRSSNELFRQLIAVRNHSEARPETIRTGTNEVILGGKNLFDPSQPYWHGKAPDLKYPE